MLMLSALCRARGYDVDTLGLMEGDEALCALAPPDVAVFPFPRAVRDGLVPCMTSLTLPMADALERARGCGLIVAGEGLDAEAICFACDEILMRTNAELSAEGALACAMRESEAALWGMRCVVTGYGRLGRALARKLTALGAWVVVLARSEDARRRARADGMSAASFAELNTVLKERPTGALFNTVPARVLDARALALLPKSCVLLELAAAPYGFELEEATALGLRALALPGIPGRYAPISAAEALYAALTRAIEEAGQE